MRFLLAAQEQIAQAAFKRQQAVESGEQVIIGVNRFEEGEDADAGLQAVDQQVEKAQLQRLARVKAERDSGAVARHMAALTQIAQGDGNLLPPIIDCVRAYATLGEISQALKAVFGEYRPR